MNAIPAKPLGERPTAVERNLGKITQPIMSDAKCYSNKMAARGGNRNHANDSLNALRSWIGLLDLTSGRLAEALARHNQKAPEQ